MALDTDYQIATDPSFQAKVQMALISTAIAIQNEGVGTANHQMRSAFAIRVLNNPIGYAQLMAPAFTVDAATNAATSDVNLEARASAIFNAFCVLS